MNKELINSLIKENPSQYHMTYDTDLTSSLPKRSLYAHKGSCGHSLLFAGSVGMAGCAILASKACMRTGVGKMTVSTPKENVVPMQIAVPEVILAMRDIAQENSLDLYDAVGIGPGLGTDEFALEKLGNVLSRTTKPMVIDADAITLLGQAKDLLGEIPTGTILTPHKKELQRLIGDSADEFDELQKTIDLAKQYNIIIVIKGAFSAVVNHDGQVFFNTTGNPGMATAGSGDVLTGIILSLLAQNVNPVMAARIGVYLHGLAGDMAAKNLFENSIIASDMIDNLPHALGKLYSVAFKG